MRRLVRILWAELKKQHRNTFMSKFTYFSLLVWPILIFINAYYTYKPFNLSQSSFNLNIGDNNKLIMFLITGYIGYNCFWSMVQSAWQMSFERQSGTIETIFLSPANRLILLYGRALGALIENIWMFTLFSIAILLISNNLYIGNIFLLPIIFIVLIISSTVWGGFMNTIFLFSRDASFLFSIFDDPMVLFSGVRIPTNVFPLWAKAISVLFPLTHVLTLFRQIFDNKPLYGSLISVYLLLGSLLIMVIITILLLVKAEKNFRKTGNLTFY